MFRPQQAGAVTMPVIPAFYDQPKTIDDLVTQYTCRVLAQIGLPQEKMYRWVGRSVPARGKCIDRKSTRLNSSHQIISYAVFCLKKKIRQSPRPRLASYSTYR